MKQSILLYLVLSLGLSCGMLAENSVRNVQTLETDWRFENKEVLNAEAINFDDAAWQTVRVPHDWAILGNFDMNLDAQLVQVKEDGEQAAKLRTGRTGALPMFGVGWYRKVLPIAEADMGKQISIEFDGAMSLAKIYLNGELIGEQPYGYSSFSFDLTKHIQFGKQNVLAVRLENKPESSRWYAGAGIYRNVRLVKTASTHVAHWGTYITTPVVNSKVAEVNIKTEVAGDISNNATVKLLTEVYNSAGKKISTVSSSQKMEIKLAFEQQVKIKNPQLWSIETPFRYTAISKVYVNNVLTEIGRAHV